MASFRAAANCAAPSYRTVTAFYFALSRRRCRRASSEPLARASGTATPFRPATPSRLAPPRITLPSRPCRLHLLRVAIAPGYLRVAPPRSRVSSLLWPGVGFTFCCRPSGLPGASSVSATAWCLRITFFNAEPVFAVIIYKSRRPGFESGLHQWLHQPPDWFRA